MAGSSVAPYIIPVGAFLALAFWLTMVFWADRHPVHGSGAGQYPGIEQFPDAELPEDWQVEMGVPRQRTAVEEAEAEAPRAPTGHASR